MNHPKIAWFGGRYYLDSLAECDAGPNAPPPTYCGPIDAPLSWDEAVARAGFEPDILVLGDQSQPPPLTGLERYPCLTVFLCVDSHIHGWHPYYAQGFDLCTVSLKDHIPNFIQGRFDARRVKWLPAFANNDDMPVEAPKEWDLLFVGNVNPETTPIRAEMLREIGRAIPGLVVRQGDYRSLFPKARLVLNIAERGDLNFRVFEALACGSCLITPRIGHGQDELFQDGQDLFTYPLNDLDALLELIRALRHEQGLREKAALSGFKKVDAHHRARHRARDFLAWLNQFNHADLVRQRLAMADEIHESALKLLYLHQAENMPPGAHRQAYLDAALKKR